MPRRRDATLRIACEACGIYLAPRGPGGATVGACLY